MKPPGKFSFVTFTDTIFHGFGYYGEVVLQVYIQM